jgi:hypothetical protein
MCGVQEVIESMTFNKLSFTERLFCVSFVAFLGMAGLLIIDFKRI